MNEVWRREVRALVSSFPGYSFLASACLAWLRADKRRCNCDLDIAVHAERFGRRRVRLGTRARSVG